jgi:hypothetical protein
MNGKCIPNGNPVLENTEFDVPGVGVETDDRRPKPRRLRSLAELGEIDDWLEVPVEPQDVDAIESLVATLSGIERDLAAVGSRDAAARRSAEATLEEHARLARRFEAAKCALDQAGRLLGEAEQLAADAFTDEARDGAMALCERLRLAVCAAEAEHDRARSAVETLARDPGLARLLAEVARKEEESRAAAARAERGKRLRESLAAARSLVAVGRDGEAASALRAILGECPADTEARSLLVAVESRSRARLITRAKALLTDIRRRLRGDPQAVITAVESLDLSALDDDLARQLFGEWLRAGRELGVEGLLRYAPLPHRGALLAPSGDGTLLVVSSVGGIALRPGETVSPGRLAGLRPVADDR